MERDVMKAMIDDGAENILNMLLEDTVTIEKAHAYACYMIELETTNVGFGNRADFGPEMVAEFDEVIEEKDPRYEEYYRAQTRFTQQTLCLALQKYLD